MKKIPILLGDVDLMAVVNEEPDFSGTTTDKPVENGSDISDHFQSNPTTISLSGSVVGKDAPRKLATLRRYHREAELLTYSGRNIFDNMQILSIPTRHNAINREGFDFDITLKQIRISRPETFEVDVASSQTAAMVKPITNKGKQQAESKQVSEDKASKMRTKLNNYTAKSVEVS